MKKTLCILLALTLLLTMAAGCGSEKADPVEEQTSDEQAERSGGSMIMARVTAIDGTNISYESFSMPGMPQNGGNGERPEMPEGEMPEMPEGERPERPDGETDDRPEMPEGERPERPDGETGERPEMPEGGKFKGESGSVTVSDTSILFKREDGKETAAELSDVETGSMLELTMDENGMVTRIVISSMGANPGEPGQKN